MKKRICTLLLAFVMILSMLPITPISAAEDVLMDQDYEDGSIAQWFMEDYASGALQEIVSTVTTRGNSILRLDWEGTGKPGATTAWLKHVGATDGTPFEEKELTLSYSVALANPDTHLIFPVMGYKDGTLSVHVGWIKGKFQYKTSWSGTWFPIEPAPGETGKIPTDITKWAQLKVKYGFEGEKPYIIVWINGVKTNVPVYGPTYNDKKYQTMYQLCGYLYTEAVNNTMYIDNLQLTRGDHEAYPVPSTPAKVFAEDVQWGYAPDTMYAGLANAEQFSLAFVPEDTSVQHATWFSSDPTVATVTDKGVVTGLNPGTVTITAVPEEPGVGPTKLEKKITIREIPLQKLAASVSKLELAVGDHAFVYAEVAPANASFPEVVYTSSDPAVVAVDEYGDVRGISAGKATMTMTAKNGMTTTVEVTVVQPSVQMTIHAAPTGKDNAAGTAQDPVSLAGALKLIEKNNKNMTGNIEVVLADGYYKLKDTLTMTSAHSGSNGYSIVWKAAEGASPVIGGGYEIAGKDHIAAETIATDRGNIYVYDVSAAGLGKRGVRQIYVNHVQAVRARSEGPLNDRAATDGGILCSNTELLNYQNPADLELVFVGLWTQPRCGVTAIREGKDGQVYLQMDQPGWAYVTGKGYSAATAENMVWYENALELLDEPGEWYMDLQAKKLYYMPRSFESVDTMQITLPVFDNYGNGVMIMDSDIGNDCDKPLVLISGDGFEDGERVSNIRFEGITFADTTWSRTNGTVGHADSQNNHVRQQSDIMATAAVVVKKAVSIHFTGCTFTRLGINALQMVQGVQNSSINGNIFFDIGGNAVNVAEPYYDSAAVTGNEMVKNITVSNNYIHDIGTEFGSSAAISIGFANYITSSHNEIFNIPYSGYHIGYGWNLPFNRNLQKIVISHNFIHDLMGDVMNDGGGIYTLGLSDTACNENNYNYITNNFIKNLLDDGGPIYNDESSSWWWVENNVIDLSEVESWPDGGPGAMNWYNNNTGSSHLVVQNNYATLPKFFDRCTDPALHNKVDQANQETDTDGDGDIDWSAPAQAIIDASGLEAAYRHLINNQVEKIGVNLTDRQLIAKDQPFTIQTTLMDGKNRPVNAPDAKVYYSVKDPGIAKIDENGVITGLSTGITTVKVGVLTNSVLVEEERSVYIGDYLDQVVLVGLEEGVRMSKNAAAGKQVEAMIHTKLGRELKPEQITYSMANSAVAAVDANGRITPVAVGETTLIVTATAEGEQITGRFHIVITEEIVSQTGNLWEIFEEENEQQWTKNGTINDWLVMDGKTVKAQINGFAIFGGRKYDNELFSFKVNMDPSTGGGGWPAIVLRAQEIGNYADIDCYIFCFGREGIELHRYVDGTRHQIYGVVTDTGVDNAAKQGGKIADSPWSLGTMHDMTVGAIADGEDVRILLIIDGETVIDYLDLGANKAISNPGYFGIFGRGETFTFRKDAKIENDAAKTYADVTIVEAPTEYTQGGEAITLTTNGALWDLKSLQLNGERLPDSAYTAAEGGADGKCAVITLSAEYLDGLEAGEYTVKALFAGDRAAETALKISGNPAAIAIPVAAVVILLGAICILLAIRKKTKK